MGADGAAGYIPHAYGHLEDLFWKVLRKHSLLPEIELVEYHRSDYTYHCKGLWRTRLLEKNPSLTVIGSSNFG